MIIIKNNIIPWKGFKCLNLFGVLFVRSGVTLTESDLRHEAIHTRQIWELFGLGFYVWYLLDYLWGLLKYRDPWMAYRSIVFEEEAYYFEGTPDYLDVRPMFFFLNFM